MYIKLGKSGNQGIKVKKKLKKLYVFLIKSYFPGDDAKETQTPHQETQHWTHGQPPPGAGHALSRPLSGTSRRRSLPSALCGWAGAAAKAQRGFPVAGAGQFGRHLRFANSCHGCLEFFFKQKINLCKQWR